MSNSHKLSSDGKAAVDKGYHWKRIDSKTPRGVFVQVIKRSRGKHTTGIIDATNSDGWTHWQALPTFSPDDPE